MSLFHVSIFGAFISVLINGDGRVLLQSTEPTSDYSTDCCERTSGLTYSNIDCYSQDTEIIIEEAQQYLFDPENDCQHTANCTYSASTSTSSSESNKCLIAWALLQQYYNHCPQIVMTTSNTQPIVTGLPQPSLYAGSSGIDYDSAPKWINPYIYKQFATSQCMQCYGEYLSDELPCNGYCNVFDDEGSYECGVCSLVLCITSAADLEVGYGMGALEMWERALLFVTVVIMGCLCCWGVCYLCCSGSNSWANRRLLRMEQEDGDIDGNSDRVQMVRDDSD